MQTLIRAAVVIALAGSLFACKPKPAPEPVAEKPPAEQAPAGPGENMIEACTITITSPENIRWTTYWDAGSLVHGSESPSMARSAYWASDDEKKSLGRTGASAPLSLRCSSNDSPNISLSFSAYTSTEKDIPLDSGEYVIVGRTQGDPGAAQFQGGSVFFDQRTIEPTSGTMYIDRFDMDGVRGSFRMEGKEEGENGQNFRIEGTFNIPCRGGPNESACESNKSLTQ